MNEVAPAAAAGVEVHPAATVMLVRDGRRGGDLEVLMLLRHLESVFAAGVWVFPGGRVDDADHGLAGLAHGRDEADASATIGVSAGGLAYWVAAARECFEEAGILLARDAATGRPLELRSELDAARLERHRRDLHAGRQSFAGILAAEGLVLDLGEVHYVSHWITPPGGTRRFDTRFFVAPAPPGQTASHDAMETVESVWTRPAGALERHRAGEIELVFPTIKNLEALARFRSVGELLDAARSIGPVPVAAPRFGGDPGIPPSALDGAALTGAMRLRPPVPASSPIPIGDPDPEPPCPT